MAKRVLLIDNDPDILDIVEEILSYEGFKVDTFEGANDILMLIEQHKPDLLIIDYRLNGINGGEHCQKIKSCKFTKNLPVIIFSAYSKAMPSLEMSGCNAYMEKPFGMEELIGKVTELIKLYPKTRINSELNEY